MRVAVRRIGTEGWTRVASHQQIHKIVEASSASPHDGQIFHGLTDRGL